jgi:hypothetical protein
VTRFLHKWRIKKDHSIPNVIISLSSGLVRPYLTYITAGESTYFVYPAQTRGIALGNALMAAFLKAHFAVNCNSQSCDKNPKVLICGSGPTIHYLIETFVMQYESMLRLNSQNETTLKTTIDNFISNNFQIVSDSNFYKEEAIIIKEDKVEFRDNSNYSYPEKHYHLHIKKALKNTVNFGPDNIRVKCIYCSPLELSNIDLIWKQKEGFDVIVIVDESAEREMIILSSFLTVINKYENYPLPVILVGAQSGHWHRLQNIADGNLFYHTMPSLRGLNPSNDIERRYQNYYPSQFGFFSKARNMAFGESMIDVLDDAKEQISGILFSFREENKGEGSALKLHLCIQNHPEALATACGQMNNFRFVPFRNFETKKEPKYKVYVPSFSFCRFIAQNRDNFCLSTYSSLRPVNIAREERQAIVRAYVTSRKSQKKDSETYKIITQFMEGRLGLNGKNLDKDFRDCDDCPFMKSCAIAGYRRHVLVRHVQKLKQPPHYYFTEPQSHPQQPKDLLVPTFAKVTACCRDADNYGSLTFLLNTLCLKILEGPMHAIQEDINVFYISYGRYFDCFEDSRSLSRVYGNIMLKKSDEFIDRVAQLSPHYESKWKSSKSASKMDPIVKGLLIRPCPQGFEYWEEYANDLLTLLNKCYKCDDQHWQIYPTDPNKRKLFGVILIMDTELFEEKQKEMKWRRSKANAVENQGNNSGEEDEYNGPPKYHLCFCGKMKGKYPKDEHQPYEDCPFNKDLNVLFGIEALEID